MCDADVDNSLDSGAPGRPEERSGVLYGQVVVDALVGEAHPVGVVERGDAFERLDQANLIVEVERANLDRSTRCPVGVPGQGADLATRVSERLGDGLARVAEGSGHRIETGIGHASGPKSRSGICGHDVSFGGANALKAPSIVTSC